MNELIFASSNPGKVKEIALAIAPGISIIGLKEIGCTESIPETADTIEGNARLKARYVWTKYQRDCFADDSGLEVDALDGAPGVHSARYAGIPSNAEKNMEKMLEDMQKQVDRRARFRTVICLIVAGTEICFEGVVPGHIAREKRGDGGFGYDPLFVPEGCSRTFGEMTLIEKNLISHRSLALAQMNHFLKAS